MHDIALIVVALLLDSLVGDPRRVWSRLPHPVRIMGAGINWLDQKLNRNRHKRLKGVLALAVLVFFAALFGFLVARLPGGWVFSVLFAAILLGQHSLVQHVEAVADGLQDGLPEGRRAVAMIVGRDTAELDQSAVARAAIESAAENFSDGVVAPVFWFVVFGLPGIVVYKLVNTADSMIGHRSDKYLEFGWAAARLDDVLNYIPARISAGLIALATGSKAAFGVIRADAGQHRSPNAGWPEAAMAGVLGIALSGPRAYEGKTTKDSFVNAGGRKLLGVQDIRAAIAVLWRSWVLMLAGLLAGLFAIWLI
ncbi:MAG: adenosylcobinamide-phosphate synthase CbiB [Rhodobacteraceae bacterium]|nr:adenosylcobinamide-phosphate synthase CbiB [Paracoccaceae bacterium]